MRLNKVTLVNDFEIFAPGLADAKVIYHEIYQMQVYDKHGITVGNKDTVIDVGANVGLFSIYLSQNFEKINYHLIEPVPEIFNHLEANCSRYLSDQDYKLHNFGLSDRNAKINFQYSPHLSMVSGMYSTELASINSKNSTVLDWLKAAFEDMQRAKVLPGWLSKLVLTALKIPVINYLTAIILIAPLACLLLWIKIGKKNVSCQLTTLSELLDKQSITEVDLVKIDVEGAEMDVIKGIKPEHWSKIKQLIIEVHDVDNRVIAMTNFLEKQGYSVSCDQEDWSLHKLMNIYTLFARR